MSPSSKSAPTAWLGVLALAGTFLLIPLWDFYALFVTLRVGWLAARSPDRRAGALAVALRPLRRLLLLSAAWALTVVALAWLSGQVVEAAAPVGAPTFRLLAAAWLSGGLLTLALIGLALTARRLAGRVGELAEGGLWLVSAALAAPVGALALVGRLLMARYGAAAPFPTLLAAGLIAALLPALIAARAGLRAWDGAQQAGLARGERVTRLGLSASRAFTEQAGWLLGSALLGEMVLGLGGLGGLLHAALLSADGAALAGVLAVLSALLLVARVRAALLESVERACCPPPAPHVSAPQAAHAPRLIVAAGLLIAALAIPAWARLSLPEGADRPDPAAIYAPRTAERPLGSDHLGRDVRALLAESQRAAWLIALSAALVATGFGGAWGLAARALDRWRGVTGETLADLLRFPADVAILLRPAAVGWLVAVAGGGLLNARFPLLGAGAALGLLLAPRLAWALGARCDAPPGRAVKTRALLAAAFFASAAFAALQIGLAAGLLAGGVSPLLVPGAGLIPYPEVVASAALAPDGRYVWLAIFAAAPSALAAVGVYLLQDALAGRAAPHCADALPRLFG